LVAVVRQRVLRFCQQIVVRRTRAGRRAAGVAQRQVVVAANRGSRRDASFGAGRGQHK
jgi:hypothetical protein